MKTANEWVIEHTGAPAHLVDSEIWRSAIAYAEAIQRDAWLQGVVDDHLHKTRPGSPKPVFPGDKAPQFAVPVQHDEDDRGDE